MKSNSLSKNQTLSFNYNMNQYLNNLSKKKDISTKQVIEISKKSPNTFRQISFIKTTQINKSTKVSPIKTSKYKNFSNDRTKILVQNYITPSTNSGSNPKLSIKEIRDFQNENSLNEMDFIKNKFLRKKNGKKINYLNLSNNVVNNKNLRKNLDITSKSSINNTRDNIMAKKSISTYEAEISYQESGKKFNKISHSKNISPRLDLKKSNQTNKNIFNFNKNYNNQLIYKNQSKNMNTFNEKLVSIKNNTKKTKIFTNNNSRGISRISSLEKKKFNAFKNKIFSSSTNKQQFVKSSNTSSMTNLLNNIKTNKDNHNLSKNHNNTNLTGNTSDNNTSLVIPTIKDFPNFNQIAKPLKKDHSKNKSNSLIIEHNEINNKKGNSLFVNNKLKSNGKVLNSLLNNINKNNKHINVINPNKRHISSSTSPKNNPFKLNNEIFLNKNKINTNNISLNSSLKSQSLVNNKPTTNNISKKVNLKLDLNKILKKDDNTNFKKNPSDENVLESSNCSIKSSRRESNYYKKEAEKLSAYIKNYFMKNKEYPMTNCKFYKYGRLLGRGAFGKVNLGLHILSGRLVAIKSFNKKAFTENSKKRIYYEFNLMKNLGNNNSIVKVYEIFETNKYIVLIMEYVCGGDLLSFIRKRTKLNEQTSKFIFRQLIESIQYINYHNIVHRDIKLDNILIDFTNTIKICDFGVSKIVKKNEVLYDQCGTPAYIAPEIIKNNGYEGFGVDIWSVGVVLYAMLSGTVPFKANNMDDLNKIISRGNYNQIKDISEEASNMINCLLEVDPKKRFNTEKILNHPFIKNFDIKKNKLVLFTNAEIVLLSKLNIDYRNSGKEDINENFTMKNLETQKESENQNIKTKSIILAPFCTSIKNENSFIDKELKRENDVIRFVGKAIELNRNYELNNNGEIDNGILINNSKHDDSNNDKNILSNNNSIIKNYSKPSTPFELNENFAKRKSSNLLSPKNESIRFSSIQSSILDEDVIKQIEDIGYKKEFLVKSILSHDLNHATTTYFLMMSSKNN